MILLRWSLRALKQGFLLEVLAGVEFVEGLGLLGNEVGDSSAEQRH